MASRSSFILAFWPTTAATAASAVSWYFLASSADNKIREFTAKDQKQVRELTGAKDWILSTDFHAGTKRLAGGTFDGQVLVWNAEDGKLVTSFYAAPGYQSASK